ncbi:MAG TPA: hypothetical protein VFC24_13300, partial [Casimicrobiaceae bacterium]|nr:hypothetical protein [Casimicrobiaceae bacterium]
ESPAYPDLRRKYLLTYVTNPVGKNIMKIGVNTNGLLTSAGAKSEAGISDALKNLATTAGTFSALGTPGLRERRRRLTAECPKGDSVYVVPAQRTARALCDDLFVTVLPLARGASGRKTGIDSQASSAKQAGAGIYYRQAQPYMVTVSGTHDFAQILFSPSGAPTHFLPVTRSLFGTGNADMTFTDGMPTKYDLDADGELIALLKLPADVIGAYFAAMGAVFDAFKKNGENETSALQAQLKAEFARQKYERCLAAIRASDTAAISALGCSQ